MIDISFLRELDKFNLIIRKRVTSSFQGARSSKSFGRGMVFQDYRIYVPGDDFRAVDWRVYARTDNFYVRRFEEERNLTIHILVDASASMKFGKPEKKFNYAAMVGLGFAYMAMKNNERFVFSTFADQLNPYRPKKGVRQLVDVIAHLNSLKVEGRSNFSDCLKTYKKVVRTRSLIIIISDFLFDPKLLEDSLPRFRNSELYIVQVLDPQERNLQLTGDLILHDAESDMVLRTFISPRLKDRYQNLLNDHIAHLEKYTGALGAKFTCVTTDTPIFDTFYKILAD